MIGCIESKLHKTGDMYTHGSASPSKTTFKREFCDPKDDNDTQNEGYLKSPSRKFYYTHTNISYSPIKRPELRSFEPVRKPTKSNEKLESVKVSPMKKHRSTTLVIDNMLKPRFKHNEDEGGFREYVGMTGKSIDFK